MISLKNGKGQPKFTEIAKALSEMIRRSSLGQIEAWYSSDTSASGGLQPGDRWLEPIRRNMKDSKEIVAILTPNSINRPWIYIESGFGAANAELEVVPLVVGLSGLGEVPFPLASYVPSL